MSKLQSIAWFIVMSLVWLVVLPVGFVIIIIDTSIRETWAWVIR